MPPTCCVRSDGVHASDCPHASEHAARVELLALDAHDGTCDRAKGWNCPSSSFTTGGQNSLTSVCAFRLLDVKLDVFTQPLANAQQQYSVHFETSIAISNNFQNCGSSQFNSLIVWFSCCTGAALFECDLSGGLNVICVSESLFSVLRLTLSLESLVSLVPNKHTSQKR